MKIDIGFAARLTVLAMLLALGGCASPLDNRNYQEGSRLWDEGRYNEALALLAKAADEEQGSAEVRQAYYRRLNDLVARFTADADNARVAGRWADAENLYRQALALKPGDERASAGLRLLEAERRHASMLESAGEKAKKGDYAAARALVDQVLKENPRHPGARGLEREFAAKRRGEAFAVPALKSSLTKPVTLEFRDASLKMVLEALSRTAGINFIFDRDVKGDARTTVFVRNVRVEDALDLILSPLQLDKKIISDNTVMIYPATPAKTKEHQDLVIRSFYLGNADPKQTVNMIKTVLKTKDVFVDERVNLLIMRDTPEAVELAERLIVTQDLAEPEVLLEIEVLEVNTQRLLDLGIKWPTTFTGPSGTLKNTFDNLSSSTITVDRGLIATLKAEDADTRLLARPQVRVRNREKAKVHIGDRVPVISAVVTPSTGTPVVTDQVQYIDVGIKLDLEPAVHLNTDVGLRIGLEVSTFQRLPPTANGTSVIQVSTRNATTVLRLKEGETSILAGLIQNLQTTTVQKVPFIGDVPVVGRLFSNTADDNRQTEIVFLITPRVVRNVEPPDVKYAEFWSGTEAQVKTRGPMMIPVGEGEGVPVAAGGRARPAATVAAAAPTALPRTQGGPLELAWDVPGQVKAGEEFQVALRASADSPLRTGSFQFRYDPRQLEVLKVDEGDYFKKSSVNMVLTEKVEPPAGRIVVTLAPSGESAGAAGSGALIVIRFKALAANPNAQVSMLAAQGRDASDRLMQIKGFGPAQFAIGP